MPIQENRDLGRVPKNERSSIARTNVLGIGISAVNLESAAATIDRWIIDGERQFVTVAAVHSVVDAQDEPVAKRAMQESHDAGYAGFAGIEPEFIVLKYDDNGQPVKAIDDDPQNGIRPRRQAFGYDVEFSIDSMPFLKDMIDILEDIGV